MTLFDDIKNIITAARSQAFRAVNSLLLTTYWQIGKCIVEDEQAGKVRAKYGEATLKILAEKLTLEFGKGFDFTNLTNMRKFYIAFPKLDALR